MLLSQCLIALIGYSFGHIGHQFADVDCLEPETLSRLAQIHTPLGAQLRERLLHRARQAIGGLPVQRTLIAE